ncbi:hypothetical protein SO694_00129036 [Aureococcus anophagefferens]|uniref:Uncharacterized protein n=1 Tax=Aureococcus anophagefferens TaxID=44056 RepID=A0ABR1G5H2_AURAN
MAGWYRAKTSGPLTPPCRYQMAHDLVGDTLYVHGGGGQGSATQQRRSLLWSLDIQTLAWKELDGPRRSLVTSRSNHSLTCCGGTLTVFGGKGLGAKAVDVTKERKHDGSDTHAPVVRMMSMRNVLNDAAVFDLAKRTWKLMPITGKWPTPRRGHTATLVKNSEVIEQAMKAAEAKELARAANQGAVDDAEETARKVNDALGLDKPDTKYVLVVGGAGPDIGGKGFETVLGQVWAFDPAHGYWAEVTSMCTGERPPARFEHTATPVGRYVVVIGGLSATVNAADALGHSDVLCLNVDTLNWAVIPTSHAATESPALYGHSACRSLASDELLVFGGSTRDSEVRVLKLFPERMDLCTWRVARTPPLYGDGGAAPFLNKKHHPKQHAQEVARTPANAFAKHKQVLGRSRAPMPARPDTAPLLDVEAFDAPPPRRGHLFSLFVPRGSSARHGAIAAPVALCFGGSHLFGGAEGAHFAGAELFLYDPAAAADVFDPLAAPAKVGGLFDAASRAGNLSQFRRLSAAAASARGGTPVGARAERAFIDTIRGDLQRSSFRAEYSYDGVKRLLQTANRERLKLKPPKPPMDDTSSVASTTSSATSRHPVVHGLLSHDHHALSNMQHDVHDVQSTVKLGKNDFQRTHDAHLSHSNSLGALPNLKNLPFAFKQIHSSCSAQDLQRIKSINARTHNKAIARKLWYEHAEPHPLAHLLPPDLQVWL